MRQVELGRCAVLGAGGKMGSGIALLLLEAGATVVCYDTRSEALDGLQSYLRVQLEKRECSENLANAIFTTDLTPLDQVDNVFEAIVEEIPVKVKLFRTIKERANPLFFTNTSSIPIGELDREADLNGRIIGFHFYNPPAVQKLLELIPSENTPPALIERAHEIAALLKKRMVLSNDVAGFIGNGHFMRDLMYACDKAGEEGEQVVTVNRITQELLLRPMGIFQLADYVGIDVCQKILRVMDRFIDDETLHAPLIDRMVETGVLGGQNSDGSQKSGFFQYEKGKPIAAYDLESGSYHAIEKVEIELPEGHEPWKVLLKDRDRANKLATYFSNLHAMESEHAGLAIDYLRHSAQIGKHLVDSGVAAEAGAVNQVLTLGFYHLYGPLNEYVETGVR